MIHDTAEYYKTLNNAASVVRERLGTASLGIILGSGLNMFADELQEKKEISFNEIPNMPTTSVAGHRGCFCSGLVAGKKVLCLAGRIHSYEGFHMYQLTFATRLLALLGCKVLIASNAAGGAVKEMQNGSIMAITDHVNMIRRNPLEDVFDDARLGSRNPEIAGCYSKKILEIAHRVAAKDDIRLFEGTYAMWTGPTYETPAEVRTGAEHGIGAFGMSTVTESVAAAAAGLEFFAVSVVTNLAAGISPTLLTHEEVTEIAKEVAPMFQRFIVGIINEIDLSEFPAPALSADAAADTWALPMPVADSYTLKEEDLVAEIPACEYVIWANGVADQSLLALGKASFTTPLTALPNFPLSSPSGKVAQLSFLAANNKQVAVVSGLLPEGLTSMESQFLVTLLAKRGAHCLVSLLNTTALTPHASGTVVPLQDAHAFATASLAPTDRHIHSRVQDNYLSLGEDVNEIYLGFAGPSYPTAAELNLAKGLGGNVSGIANIAHINAAHNLGMRQALFACVTATAPAKPSDPSAEQLQKLVSAVEAVLAADAKKATPVLKFPRCKTQATPENHSRYLQLPASILASAKEVVLSQLVKDAVVTKGILLPVEARSAFEKQFDVIRTLPFSAVPYLKETALQVDFGPSAEFALATPKGSATVVLVCVGQFALCDNIPTHEMTLPARLLASCGCETVFFAPEVYAVDRCTARLALLTDHINQCAIHPLTGHNVAEYGARFPDMTEGYCSKYVKLAESAAKKLGLTAESGVALHEVGPDVTRPAVRLIGRNLKCKFLIRDTVPDVLVSCHHGAKGCVVATVKSESSTFDDALSVIRELI
eukprot:GCRY01000800.1.p1 GENE.GCRY01000800.1~~GCRY01000800.1.p1  ORF type:complete len:883 (+),score=284.96 GCRY01000800.1:176-2650(+)